MRTKQTDDYDRSTVKHAMHAYYCTTINCSVEQELLKTKKLLAGLIVVGLALVGSPAQATSYDSRSHQPRTFHIKTFHVRAFHASHVSHFRVRRVK